MHPLPFLNPLCSSPTKSLVIPLTLSIIILLYNFPTTFKTLIPLYLQHSFYHHSPCTTAAPQRPSNPWEPLPFPNIYLKSYTTTYTQHPPQLLSFLPQSHLRLRLSHYSTSSWP